MSSSSSCSAPTAQQYIQQLTKKATEPLKDISKPELAQQEPASELNTNGSRGRNLNITV